MKFTLADLYEDHRVGHFTLDFLAHKDPQFTLTVSSDNPNIGHTAIVKTGNTIETVVQLALEGLPK